LRPGDYPDWSRRFRDIHGNPAEWLKSALAVFGGETDLAMPEAIDGNPAHVRKELEGPAPTAIESLLAERAAFCWFAVNVYEALYTASKDLTIRQADFQLRRIESAHRRFLSAVVTLARVRKRALPSIQVNVGANRVNIS
jgi:hypothetical protein